MGIEPPAQMVLKPRVIISEFSNIYIGFIVHEAKRIRRINWKNIEPANFSGGVGGGGALDKSKITGVTRIENDDVLLILDLESIVQELGIYQPKMEIDIADFQQIDGFALVLDDSMTNVAHILSVADDSSLVLIDELGAGTDPTEGAALAVSIIEALRSKGAKIAATTHYAELKAYALDTDGVINGCCEFDVDTLSPTYRLLIGVPGRSNAFAISLRIGIDEAVVNHAREIVSSENRDFEAILDKLENARLELEEEKKKAQKLTEKANRFAAKAQSEKDKINTLKERELDKAKQEADRD